MALERRDAFDLRSLEVFLAIAESRSMVRAAERLGITQAAVSQSLARLEQALETGLIDRGVRPLKLTLAGAALAERTRPHLAGLRETRQAVRQIGRTQIPELRLALVNSLAGAVMPDFYTLLREQLQVEKVSLLTGIARDNLAALAEGRVDAVMTADVAEAAAHLRSMVLLTEPFVAVVPAGAGAQGSLSDLARRLPFIGYSEDSVIGRLVRTQLQRLRLAPEVPLVVDASLGMMDVIAGGHGWTIATPLCLLEGRADPSRVSVRPIREPMLRRRMMLYTRQHELGEFRSRLASVAVSALARSVPERLGPYGDWIGGTIRLGPATQE